jgi:hypothetical protein
MTKKRKGGKTHESSLEHNGEELPTKVNGLVKPEVNICLYILFPYSELSYKELNEQKIIAIS